MTTRRFKLPLFAAVAALTLAGLAGTARADPCNRWGGGGYYSRGYSYGYRAGGYGSYGRYYGGGYGYRNYACGPGRGYGFSFYYNRGGDCYRPCPPRPRCGW